MSINSEREMIEFLDTKKPLAQYMKGLIRKDMEANK